MESCELSQEFVINHAHVWWQHGVVYLGYARSTCFACMPAQCLDSVGGFKYSSTCACLS